MSAQNLEHHTMDSHPGSPVTRSGFNPPQHHTHLQRVAFGLLVDRSGGGGC